MLRGFQVFLVPRIPHHSTVRRPYPAFLRKFIVFSCLPAPVPFLLRSISSPIKRFNRFLENIHVLGDKLPTFAVGDRHREAWEDLLVIFLNLKNINSSCLLHTLLFFCGPFIRNSISNSFIYLFFS